MAERSSLDSSPELPVVTPLPSDITIAIAFRKLAHLSHCAMLESTLPHDSLGRYSFLAVDPFEVITAPYGDKNASGKKLALLHARLAEFQCQAIEGLPPYQGGAVGVLSYELGGVFERLPAPRFHEFDFPELHLGLYDTILAFDHQQQQGWCISQGFPELERKSRLRRAQQRSDWIMQLLRSSETLAPRPEISPSIEPQGKHLEVRPGIFSNFSEQSYREAVERAVELILAGDAFQVNLSQRLLIPGRPSPINLYERLRTVAPATFAGYYDLGMRQVLTISPERFLQVEGDAIEARPIKGTRRGLARPVADLFARADLNESEKDRAENTMIVDLMRNDLSRICLPDSLQVPQLCGLESYGYIHHLVSVVRGKLRGKVSPFELLAATFPGGSVTGAPKIRAMQIIQELEQVARGAYCGSLGYFGFHGQVDLNILIRTISLGGGWMCLPVGGGIIATSNPDDELRETWHKAAGMLRAVHMA
jgi:para-aminobenzoate synthetase component I